MKYLSSKGGPASGVGFGDALLAGLAPGGGLFVPAQLPALDVRHLPPPDDLPAFAAAVLAPFLADDGLAAGLPEIARAAFHFPVPVEPLGEPDLLLELFHGPTLAFKDLGAGFLAACLERLGEPRRILVATTGDTGGAVAAACHGAPHLLVGVLYPARGVSPAQERFLHGFGGNVQALPVAGDFDACQALVDESFARGPWPRAELTTANSTNVARLLPQVVHHALAAQVAWARHGRPSDLVVPSGNLGNGTAALLAKRLGFPIERVVLAANANAVVPRFVASGRYEPARARRTLANSMDVGAPRNLERVRRLFADHDELAGELAAVSIDDAGIRAAIRAAHERHGLVLDPHTAAAYAARERRTGSVDGRPQVVVGTAHAAKFPEVVEPLTGVRPAAPEAFRARLAAGERALARGLEPVAPTLDALVHALEEAWARDLDGAGEEPYRPRAADHLVEPFFGGLGVEGEGEPGA